ncbi:hypothetical protein MPER_11359, partial [Moniliophthora perniciosa FA553]
DEVAIPKILDTLDRLKFDFTPAIRFSEQQVEARRLAPRIVFKHGEYSEGSQWSEWNELHVFLFDHCLIMAREKEKDGEINYLVQGRVGFGDPPVKRDASAFNINKSSSSADPERYFYPFSIQHAGRTRKAIFLFTESEDSRAEWKEELETVMSQRSIAQVFDLEPLNTETFWFQSISQSKIPIPSHGAMTGRIACTAVFHLDNLKMLAVGCFEGLWMGLAGDSQGFKRVLSLKHVWQCAVIEELGILLVRAEYTLFAYHAALWPSGASPDQARYRTRNISVQYFKLGPIAENIHSTTANTNAKKTEMDWFRTLGTFSTDEDSSGLDFIGGNACVVFTKSGFEIVDLSDPANPTFRTKLPKLGASLPASFIKRMEICHIIGTFKLSEYELPAVF